jgi:hypothetical protein
LVVDDDDGRYSSDRPERALNRGIGLEDHAVLIRLRIDRRDDALPEGIIEHVVDGRGRDAESRRGRSVDHEIGRRSLLLHVARDVRELRQLFELLHELGYFRQEIVVVGTFDDELVLRAADRGIDRDVLQRLHVQGDAEHIGGLLLQSADDLACA